MSTRHGMWRRGDGQARRNERGYVTLFVLAIALGLFLALGTAFQAVSFLHQATTRQAAKLQMRATSLTIAPDGE